MSRIKNIINTHCIISGETVLFTFGSSWHCIPFICLWLQPKILQEKQNTHSLTLTIISNANKQIITAVRQSNRFDAWNVPLAEFKEFSEHSPTQKRPSYLLERFQMLYVTSHDKHGVNTRLQFVAPVSFLDSPSSRLDWMASVTSALLWKASRNPCHSSGRYKDSETNCLYIH